jgi:hypothetical protein
MVRQFIRLLNCTRPLAQWYFYQHPRPQRTNASPRSLRASQRWGQSITSLPYKWPPAQPTRSYHSTYRLLMSSEHSTHGLSRILLSMVSEPFWVLRGEGLLPYNEFLVYLATYELVVPPLVCCWASLQTCVRALPDNTPNSPRARYRQPSLRRQRDRDRHLMGLSALHSRRKSGKR